MGRFALPTLVSAKLALYEAIRETHISNIEFGKRRRLLDLEHRSHIGQVEAGLQALGRRLKVEVQEAA